MDRWLEMTVYFIKRVINGNRGVKKRGFREGTAAFVFFQKKCVLAFCRFSYQLVIAFSGFIAELVVLDILNQKLCSFLQRKDFELGAV